MAIQKKDKCADLLLMCNLQCEKRQLHLLASASNCSTLILTKCTARRSNSSSINYLNHDWASEKKKKEKPLYIFFRRPIDTHTNLPHNFQYTTRVCKKFLIHFCSVPIMHLCFEYLCIIFYSQLSWGKHSPWMKQVTFRKEMQIFETVKNCTLQYDLYTVLSLVNVGPIYTTSF